MDPEKKAARPKQKQNPKRYDKHILRLTPTTNKSVKGILKRLNNTKPGRPITPDQLVAKAVGLLQERHYRELIDASLTHEERFRLGFQEYKKGNPEITYDEYFKLANEKLTAITRPAFEETSIDIEKDREKEALRDE